MDNTLIKLVNPEFTIEFMGKEYRVRKATLDKSIQYQQRVKELKDDPGIDGKLSAAAIYIMLKSQIPDLTEQMVLENTPGDINPIDIAVSLGFLSPSRMSMVKAIQEKLTQ